jgi:hypothetical protein
MELLQSSALPLGYVAGNSGWRESNPRVDLGKVTGYHYITPARDWASATILPTSGPVLQYGDGV